MSEQRYATPDADILAAIEKALAEGDTEVNGWPATESVADRLGMSNSWADERLRDLADEGRVVIRPTTRVGTGGHINTVQRAKNVDDETPVWRRGDE